MLAHRVQVLQGLAHGSNGALIKWAFGTELSEPLTRTWWCVAQIFPLDQRRDSRARLARFLGQGKPVVLGPLSAKRRPASWRRGGLDSKCDPNR